MVKSQQPQQILTTFKQKAPEKLATKKKTEHTTHKTIKGKEETLNTNIKKHNRQNTLNKTYPH